MKPRTLLLTAVALGVVAAVLLQVESWRTRGGTVIVFRASRAVQPPATLQGAYDRVGMPRSSYDGMASQVPSVELERWVASTPVVRPVRAGEIITFDALQRSAEQGPTIGAGMRGVAIEVRQAQAAGFLVRPGDYVDILGTVPDEQQVVAARHLLQAKRVLAVDQQYRLEDSAFLQSRDYSTVTLEVTPAEAEVIEAYRGIVREGFSLALRPKGDRETVTTPGYSVTEIGRR
jgi:Flp pilus assembly protein CpaB